MKSAGSTAANAPATPSNAWGERPRRFVAMRLEHLPEVQLVERLAHPVGAWDAAAFTQTIRLGHECWTVWCGGSLAGHAVMAVPPRGAHLLNLCVRPAAQRRGHGLALTRHMIDRAQRRGAATLTLEVRPSNTGAGRLYAALGFRQIGRHRDFYRSPRESARLLELRLAAPAIHSHHAASLAPLAPSTPVGGH